MALIEVATIYDPIAAQLMRGRLVAAGIDAHVFDSGIASVIGPGVSGLRVLVDEACEDDARALLADLE